MHNPETQATLDIRHRMTKNTTQKAKQISNTNAALAILYKRHTKLKHASPNIKSYSQACVMNIVGTLVIDTEYQQNCCSSEYDTCCLLSNIYVVNINHEACNFIQFIKMFVSLVQVNKR